MNIAKVMDELGEALESIEDLRVAPYWEQRINPPQVVVGWPEQYEFDRTYGRGMDHAHIPVSVAVGKVDARSSRDRLAQYADGSGDSSIKRAIDRHDTSVWDQVRVESVEFEVITVAGAEYLAATFQVGVWAQGDED